jgi:hypothetical protein
MKRRCILRGELSLRLRRRSFVRLAYWLRGVLWGINSVLLQRIPHRVVVRSFLLLREMRKMLCVLPAGFTLRWRHTHTFSGCFLRFFVLSLGMGKGLVGALSSARRDAQVPPTNKPTNVCLATVCLTRANHRLAFAQTNLRQRGCMWIKSITVRELRE